MTGPPLGPPTLGGGGLDLTLCGDGEDSPNGRCGGVHFRCRPPLGPPDNGYKYKHGETGLVTLSFGWHTPAHVPVLA